MRTDLEWLAHMFAWRLRGDQARRFRVFRVYLIGPRYPGELAELIYSAGQL